MLIPTTVVHRAALAIKDYGDVGLTEFEDAYHCKFGMSPDVVNYYYVQFDTEQDASIFVLRWM